MGVLTPLKKSLPHNYADSPFVDSIALVEMPKNFTFPNMKLYNSTTNPNNHIASYKQMMFTAAIPHNLRESCICKGFEFSLVGPTLKLYTYLQNNSISFFTQLTNTFVEQFVSRKKFEKLSSNLYKVHQHRKELLSNYVFWFNYEKVSIPYCNQETTVDAF